MIVYYTNNYDKNKKSSHELLETAIALQLGDEARAKSLVESLYQSTEYGKPAIPGYAEFSISHSESSWAVLIDDEASLGCGLDIQYFRETGTDVVCRKYYSEEEQEAVASRGKSEFFRIWARREALVKTVGTTIVNRGLPAVLEDKVRFEGREWIVKDLTIPGLEGACAAIVYSDRDMDEEVKYVEIA